MDWMWWYLYNTWKFPKLIPLDTLLLVSLTPGSPCQKPSDRAYLKLSLFQYRAFHSLDWFWSCAKHKWWWLTLLLYKSWVNSRSLLLFGFSLFSWWQHWDKVCTASHHGFHPVTRHFTQGDLWCITANGLIVCAGTKNGEKKHLRDTPKILPNGNELQISIVVSVNRYLSSMEYGI